MSVKKSKSHSGVNSKRSRRSNPKKRSYPKKSSKKPRKKSHYAIKIFLLLGMVFLSYVFFLDYQIKAKFAGRLWQLPAHVYARPLELFPGKSISAEQLLYELKYLNYQQVFGLPEKQGQYRQINDTFEIKTRDFVFWDGKEKHQAIRVHLENNNILALSDIKTNSDISVVRFDAAYFTGIFPAHSQDRSLLKLDDVPDMFLKILLLIEDRRYFSHRGVDPKSIARALYANIMSSQTLQGGSTLTQQLVKNLFLYQQKSLVRKINEAIMSLLLEFHYDKKTILETYINEIYLGQDGKRAIHGFGLASEYYYAKALKKLSIDEMATLVGIVKGASYYNPKRNPEYAKSRRNVVLNSMQTAQLITARQAERLKKKPVKTAVNRKLSSYPAFVDAVKEQLKQDYHAKDLQSEGLRIFTSLDPYIQYKTEQAVLKTIDKLSKNNKLQLAAVVVSPLSGDLLAIVGDRNPSAKGFNRALNAKRQVGSLMKPAVYLTAVEQTEAYTLATMLDDSPLSVSIKNQTEWRPQNYDKKYHGKVTLYEALLKSYNIPVVRTGLDVGIDNVIQTLQYLGYRKKVQAYPSLTLGTILMSPMEVVSIYQGLAADGFHLPIRSVYSVLDKNAKPLQRYSLNISNRINPESVAIINSALIDVTKFGTARKISETSTIQLAGKTGTSDELRDSWFAGFSGDIVAAVWLGNDDNTPTGLTGASGAMKVWQAIIKNVAHKPYDLPEMPGLTREWVSLENGYLSRKDCENAVQLVFKKGSQPQQRDECASAKTSNWFLNLFN